MTNIKAMDIQLSSNEQHLQHLVDEFNRLCIEEAHYPDILSWDHYELFLRSNGTTPQEWKNFRLNPKVKQWYDEEQDLQLRSKLMKLLGEMGDAKSTGQAQTLSALLKQVSDRDKVDTSTKYIYSFVPLTIDEEKNPNINILDSIPPEIADAIQTIGPRTNKK